MIKPSEMKQLKTHCCKYSLLCVLTKLNCLCFSRICDQTSIELEKSFIFNIFDFMKLYVG